MTQTTVSLLEAALSYAGRGWPCVPLHTPIAGVCDCPKRSACISPGKHPRTSHGVDDATTDLEKIRMWWGPRMWPQANIGIDLVRAGLLDIAPDSVQWHAEFIARGLPRTGAFRSGGGDGHEHYLYRRPDTCPAHRLCKPGEYDILSAGYAVMPPSLHASGQRYAWAVEPDVLTFPPDWGVNMLQDAVRSVHHLNTENGVVHVTGSEPPIRLSGVDLEMWAGQHPRVKPDGKVDRSGSLWDIGCVLARGGASRSSIVHALQDRDEVLGWSKYVGRRDASTRYAVLADRVLSGEAPRIRLKRAGPANGLTPVAARKFKLITAEELKNRPDPEWLIDDVVQKDTLALLVGAQETLKTFTALDMALSIGTGVSWQGYPVAAPGVSVYVSSEGGAGLGLRVAAWEKAHNVEVGSRCLFLADQAPQLLDRKNGGDVDELLASINDLGAKPVFIVIDTAARSMVGGDENSAQDMGLFIASADQIRQATGGVVLLVHHNNRAGSARGSSALLGAVHTIIESSREENSKYLVLKCGKQKDADHFQSLMMETEIVTLGANEQTGLVRTSLVLNRRSITGGFSSIAQRAPELNSTAREMLVALIKLGEASFSQWLSAGDLAKTTFRRTRNMLIEDGFVNHIADRYSPSEAGRKACVTIGAIWGQPGATAPNGPEAIGGAKIGATTGPRREGPVAPLAPHGTEVQTKAGEDLPW